MFENTMGFMLALLAGVAIAAVQEIIGKLGLTVDNAKSRTIEAFWAGDVEWGIGAKAFKAASPAGRVNLVTGGIAWVKPFAMIPESSNR